MENFIAFFAKARRPKPTVGLALDGETLCACVLDDEQKPHYTRLAQTQGALNTPIAGLPCALKHCQPVASLDFSQVWYKAVITPHSTPATCHQQVLQILSENLPLPPAALHFDYHAHALQHEGTRRQIDCVEIIACKREHLQAVNKTFSPLPLTALDSRAHALHRAFAFAAPEAGENALYLYLTRDLCCLIHAQAAPLNFLYHSDLEGALSAWQSRFGKLKIEHVVIYNTTDCTLNLPWAVAQTALCTQEFTNLTALGCALWQRRHDA
ncbi:hypothetical protein KRX11_04930 [Pasteurellaceae bacterium TAE3-ERU1]|nr:hypothetical protein [Pasteurellaceae bacterium TAE3-ERU1]